MLHRNHLISLIPAFLLVLLLVPAATAETVPVDLPTTGDYVLHGQTSDRSVQLNRIQA